MLTELGPRRGAVASVAIAWRASPLAHAEALEGPVPGAWRRRWIDVPFTAGAPKARTLECFNHAKGSSGDTSDMLPRCMFTPSDAKEMQFYKPDVVPHERCRHCIECIKTKKLVRIKHLPPADRSDDVVKPGLKQCNWCGLFKGRAYFKKQYWDHNRQLEPDDACEGDTPRKVRYCTTCLGADHTKAGAGGSAATDTHTTGRTVKLPSSRATPYSIPSRVGNGERKTNWSVKAQQEKRMDTDAQAQATRDDATLRQNATAPSTLVCPECFEPRDASEFTASGASVKRSNDGTARAKERCKTCVKQGPSNRRECGCCKLQKPAVAYDPDDWDGTHRTYKGQRCRMCKLCVYSMDPSVAVVQRKCTRCSAHKSEELYDAQNWTRMCTPVDGRLGRLCKSCAERVRSLGTTTESKQCTSCAIDQPRGCYAEEQWKKNSQCGKYFNGQCLRCVDARRPTKECGVCYQWKKQREFDAYSWQHASAAEHEGSLCRICLDCKAANANTKRCGRCAELLHRIDYTRESFYGKPDEYQGKICRLCTACKKADGDEKECDECLEWKHSDEFPRWQVRQHREAERRLLCVTCIARVLCGQCGARKLEDTGKQKFICPTCTTSNKSARGGAPANATLARLVKRKDGLFSDCTSHASPFIASMIRSKDVPNCVKRRICLKPRLLKAQLRRERKAQSCERGLLQLSGEELENTLNLAGWKWSRTYKRWFSKDAPCVVCLQWKSRYVSVHAGKVAPASGQIEDYLARPIRDALKEATTKPGNASIARATPAGTAKGVPVQKTITKHAAPTPQKRKPTTHEWLMERHMCNRCATHVRAGRTSPVAWNRLNPEKMPYSAEPPEALRGLTLQEQRLIGIVAVAADLHLARSYEQRNLHGCVVVAARDEHSTVDYLSNLYKNVGQDVTSVLIESTRENQDGYHQVWNYQARTAKLRDAYIYLQKHNPLYEHIDISSMLAAIERNNNKPVCAQPPEATSATKKGKRSDPPAARDERHDASSHEEATQGGSPPSNDAADMVFDDDSDLSDIASVCSDRSDAEEPDVPQVFTSDDAIGRFGRTFCSKLSKLSLKMHAGAKVNSTSPAQLRDVDCKAFPNLFPYGPPGIESKDHPAAPGMPKLEPGTACKRKGCGKPAEECGCYDVKSRAEYLKARFFCVNPTSHAELAPLHRATSRTHT